MKIPVPGFTVFDLGFGRSVGPVRFHGFCLTEAALQNVTYHLFSLKPFYHPFRDTPDTTIQKSVGGGGNDMIRCIPNLSSWKLTI